LHGFFRQAEAEEELDLFITAELCEDVSAAFLDARTDVQDALEAALVDQCYGPAVGCWYLIAIIMPGDLSATFPETQKYRRRQKDIEFRLFLDHKAFRKATPIKRRRLLCELLLRSVTTAEGMAIRGLDSVQLRRDIIAAGTERRWLPAPKAAEPGAAPDPAM
jgi:hypothetical protein